MTPKPPDTPDEENSSEEKIASQDGAPAAPSRKPAKGGIRTVDTPGLAFIILAARKPEQP